jgi:hypothetical protein
MSQRTGSRSSEQSVSAEMAEPNPYDPPMVSEASQPSRRTAIGFRHIPAVILTVLGLFVAIGGIAVGSLSIYTRNLTDFGESSGVLAGGIFWILAGRSCYRRRWAMAVLLTISGYFLIGAVMNDPM